MHKINFNGEVYQYICGIGHKHGWGIWTSCPHFKIIPCKCVKRVYSLNEIQIDFTKCSINFLDLESIKQRSFILIEEFFVNLIDVVDGKV
jgi:hypothetical protein